MFLKNMLFLKMVKSELNSKILIKYNDNLPINNSTFFKI